MGRMKDISINHENFYHNVVQTALDLNILKQCNLHEDSIYEHSDDLEKLYATVTNQFNSGEYKNLFTTAKELHNAIHEVMRDYAGVDSCPICENWKDQ